MTFPWLSILRPIEENELPNIITEPSCPINVAYKRKKICFLDSVKQ